MSIVLVGGGPDTVKHPGCCAVFDAALLEAGENPKVAYVLANVIGEAELFLPAYKALFTTSHQVIKIWAKKGQSIDPSVFDGVAAIVVGGGNVSTYYEALQPCFDKIKELVAGGVSYLGFSAGAIVASSYSLLGGRLRHGIDAYPANWDEGLAEITIKPGIGLIEAMIEAHCAQAGTLAAMLILVADGDVPSAIGIDEDTAIVVEPDGSWKRTGRCAAWVVSPTGDGAALVRRELH